MVLILVTASLILIFPLPLPIVVSDTVQNIYNFVEKLPAGTVTYVNIGSIDWFDGVVFPPLVAEVNQLFEIHAHIIFVNLGGNGYGAYAQYAARICNPASGITNLRGAVYGQDFVILPNVGGGEAGTIAWVHDIWGTTPNDYAGTPLSALPMMANVHTGADIGFVVTTGTLVEDMRSDIRQVQNKYGMPLLMVTNDAFAPGLQPFVSSKQAIGVLHGSEQGAELETLVGVPGQGLASVGQTTIFVILFIAVTAVGLVTAPRKKMDKKMGVKS